MFIYLCASKQARVQHLYWTYNVAQIDEHGGEKLSHTGHTMLYGWMSMDERKMKHLTCLSNNEYTIVKTFWWITSSSIGTVIRLKGCEFNPLKTASSILALVNFCSIAYWYLSMMAGLALSLVKRYENKKVINKWSPFLKPYEKLKTAANHVCNKKSKWFVDYQTMLSTY